LSYSNILWAKELIDQESSGISPEISNSEKLSISLEGGDALYGEFPFDSADIFFSRYLKLTADDVFYDPCAGLGKLALQVHLTTPAKKVVAVEISKTRSLAGQKILNKMKEQGNLDSKREIQFINKNIFDVDISDATVIYLACYVPDVWSYIMISVANIPGVRIATLKPLINSHNFPYFKLVNIVNLRMSWNNPQSTSPIYIYQTKIKPKLP
jgi:hypothetical protein